MVLRASAHALWVDVRADRQQLLPHKLHVQLDVVEDQLVVVLPGSYRGPGHERGLRRLLAADQGDELARLPAAVGLVNLLDAERDALTDEVLNKRVEIEGH